MAVLKPYVITIVGAESSGKTRLAMQLAAHFGCLWVPEYAREYLTGLGRAYHERDLEIIAERQLEMINVAVSRAVLSGSTRMCERQSKHESSIVSLVDVIKSKIYNLESEIVIVDSGMLTMRMWAKIRFDIQIPIVEEALKDDVTDLYILCRPRREWEQDPFREAPEVVERAWIFNQYLNELMKARKEFEIVKSQ